MKNPLKKRKENSIIEIFARVAGITIIKQPPD
jgi:hypothetical protein